MRMHLPRPVIPNPRGFCGVRDLLFGPDGVRTEDFNRATRVLIRHRTPKLAKIVGAAQAETSVTVGQAFLPVLLRMTRSANPAIVIPSEACLLRSGRLHGARALLFA